MEPTTPVLNETYQSQEKVYAKDQPQYKPLPTHRSKDGIVLSRWTLTESERVAVASGSDLFLYNWTFNQPLQPIRLEVCDKESLNEIALSMNLICPESGQTQKMEK